MSSLAFHIRPATVDDVVSTYLDDTNLRSYRADKINDTGLYPQAGPRSCR